MSNPYLKKESNKAHHCSAIESEEVMSKSLKIDQRQLAILAGQAFNLSHAELNQHINGDIDLELVKKRAEEIFVALVENYQNCLGE